MKGIVLDFDGVIAKSMELHAEAYRRTLDPFGVPVADQDIFIREGARSETIIRDLLQANGKRLTDEKVQELADQKQKTFESLGPVSVYEGADDMVRKLDRGGIKLGLVTGTRRKNLDDLIPKLLPKFHAVLAQDAYTRDKPDPEPYTKTAEALGIEPGSCAALENAVRGVESAKAAEYGWVVAITTTTKKPVLGTAGADVVVHDHAAAADALLDWVQRAEATAEAE